MMHVDCITETALRRVWGDVMQCRDIGRILSFDLGFDGIPGIVRLG